MLRTWFFHLCGVVSFQKQSKIAQNGTALGSQLANASQNAIFFYKSLLFYCIMCKALWEKAAFWPQKELRKEYV